MALHDLIKCPLHELEPGLYSVLEEAERPAHYDDIAGVYDLIIGSWLYNRVMWGNPLSEYRGYSHEAIHDAAGPVLDAGCGSLVFTAADYANSTAPVILLDRSLGMLRRARTRLTDAHPSIVVQGDLYDLPFDDAVFERVYHLAVAHVLPERLPVLRELHRVLRPGGTLYITSLIRGSWIGDAWAQVLHRRGEVTAPYDADVLLEELASVGFETEHRTRANALYAWAQKTLDT